MGYNRRALVWKAAGMVSQRQGCRARACDLLTAHRSRDGGGHPSLSYNLWRLPETNVCPSHPRAYLDAVDVTDRELLPLVERSCPITTKGSNDDPRTCTTRYGAYQANRCSTLRRSASHVRQSKFEGAIARSARRSFVIPLAHRTDTWERCRHVPTSWASGSERREDAADESIRVSWPEAFAVCAMVSGLHRQWR